MAKNTHNPYQCVLCSTAEAAEYLGVSVSWLEKDRASDDPKVKFVSQGKRRVQYRKTDLDNYIKNLG